MDQISSSLDGWANALLDLLLWLLDLARAAAGHVTQDHLEGAFVVTVLFLGPSLVIGLLSGFWEGLRIEWRRLREIPRVIDGDTIEIRGENIRLFAADAPEMGQPWWDDDGRQQDAGLIARDALETLVKGRRLSVKVLREDQYQRSVAIVKVDGRDLAKSLVSQGLAFAAPGSSRYKRTEMSARRRKKGFWRGEVQMPWDYRAIV
jgi:endonuclease YncB( thermonuclease family)